MTVTRRALLSTAGAITLAARARAAEKTRITLWHAMSAALGEELNKLIAAFNASQDNVEVTGVFKGAYKDLLTSVVAAYRAGQAPHVAQVFEVGTQTMLSSGPVIKPVWQLVQETGVAIDADAYIPAVRGYFSTPDGKLASMPFNSSTAIAWYNLDVLEKAGVGLHMLPRTWQEVEAAMHLVRRTDAAPFGVTIASVVWSQFEQYGAIHNLPFATEANGFKGLDAVLKVNSPPFVKHLQRLIDMAKDNSFHYTGRDGVGDGAFLNGQSAMACSTSALRGDLRRSAKFRWAPGFLPFDPDVIREPINSAIGGASFWVLTAPNRSGAEYHAVAEFLRFLGQPQQDAQWSVGTGYVPVTHAGYELLQKQGWFEQNPGTDLPVKQLTRGQVTDNSRGFHLGRMPEIRTIIEEECEKALAGQQRGRARQQGTSRLSEIGQDLNMAIGVWRDVVDRLTHVPLAERARLLTLPPTSTVAALHQIELQQPLASPASPSAIRIAAWNLERCLYPEASARILQRNHVDLALLTELDVGVLRTGQVHTIGRMAAQLGQGYCYGCEFLELVPMDPPPGFPRNGTDNSEGYHGNGMISSLAMQDPVVFRLDELTDWHSPAEGQRRIGNRMAIAAIFHIGGIRLVACSVHLESRTDAAGRAQQMRSLLDALDAYAGSGPVVIGGDLNTQVVPGGHTDASEPLFALAASRGYDWTTCNLARPTTRASAWSNHEGTRQLDWFCTRGVKARGPAVVPALGEDGTVLSDHELILLTLDAG